MFKDGSYSYVSSQATPQDTQTEAFSYKIVDRDGDVDTATLTINVVEATRSLNAASDYGNQTDGENTTIDGRDAYKTDDVDGAQVFGFDQDDVLSGNDGNDAIYGWTGADRIYGDAGNDLISGEQDNNVLYGEDGADVFDMHVDKANTSKYDTIMDFDLDEGDVLSLANVISGFGSNSDINDFVRIQFEGTTAVVQVNTNGEGNDYHNVAKIKSHNDLNAKTLNVEDLFDKGHIDVY